MSATTKTFTFQKVAEHNTKEDLYLLIHGKVYDCSSFISKHPGGEEVLLDLGGRDATEAFEDIGHSDEARELLDKFKIGNMELLGHEPTIIDTLSEVSLAKAKSTLGFREGAVAVTALFLSALFATYQLK